MVSVLRMIFSEGSSVQSKACETRPNTRHHRRSVDAARICMWRELSSPAEIGAARPVKSQFLGNHL